MHMIGVHRRELNVVIVVAHVFIVGSQHQDKAAFMLLGQPLNEDRLQHPTPVPQRVVFVKIRLVGFKCV